MKCDLCDNEATVHEVTIQHGQKIEKHLCEKCAVEAGIAIQTQPSAEALLSQFMVGVAHKQTPKARSPVCQQCGMSYAQFRQHGLLGCPDCYLTFEKQLVQLLERAQEGGTEHFGKTPHRSVGALRHQRRIMLLRRQLADALEAERYERAAELRDELRGVGVDVISVPSESPEDSKT